MKLEHFRIRADSLAVVSLFRISIVKEIIWIHAVGQYLKPPGSLLRNMRELEVCLAQASKVRIRPR